MKIKKDFIIRRIMDDVILVPVGNTETKFNGLITTNEVGGFIWEQLTASKTNDEIIKKLLDGYEVDEKTAKRDLDEFLETLRKNGIIE
ncbi:MAG TPA: PqqD family protein [Bacillota bacterium]|nr:PqqD family protein [Bacillota bacterium]